MDWYPSEYYIQPHYSTMPAFIRVVDRISPQLSGARKDFWVRARDAGFAQWAPVGFEVRIRRFGAYKDNRTTLNFNLEVPTNLGAWHYFEDPVCCGVKPGCDWIHIHPANFEQQFLSRNIGPTRYWVAHEFGHSLGFGHGGSGIMDQTPEHAAVNREEINAAKTYWGIP